VPPALDEKLRSDDPDDRKAAMVETRRERKAAMMEWLNNRRRRSLPQGTNAGSN
jgi:hypothetical protein